MDNVKGRMTADKCPSFYKEQIKTPPKTSLVKNIVTLIKNFRRVK